jgi:hypothetical protein
MCRPQEVTSDWKSKLTTCIGYWAVRRFCSPAPGPVRCFFRALGLQVRPSSRQSRRIRFRFSATPYQAGCASRCQRAFRQPHAGCFTATARSSARSCASSKPISGFFLRNADRFWPRILQARRSDAPNFSTAMRTARRRGSGLRIFPSPPR